MESRFAGVGAGYLRCASQWPPFIGSEVNIAFSRFYPQVDELGDFAVAWSLNPVLSRFHGGRAYPFLLGFYSQAPVDQDVSAAVMGELVGGRSGQFQGI